MKSIERCDNLQDSSIKSDKSDVTHLHLLEPFASLKATVDSCSIRKYDWHRLQTHSIGLQTSQHARFFCHYICQ